MWQPSFPPTPRESRHSHSRVRDCDRDNRLRPSLWFCVGPQVYRTSPWASRSLTALITSRSSLFLRGFLVRKDTFGFGKPPPLFRRHVRQTCRSEVGRMYRPTSPSALAARVGRALATNGARRLGFSTDRFARHRSLDTQVRLRGDGIGCPDDAKLVME